MKKIKNKWEVCILIAMLLGFSLGGYISPEIMRAVVTFNDLFSRILSFIIPLLIVGLMIPAIANTGKHAGSLLLLTIALAYVAMIISGFASFFTGGVLFPALIEPGVLGSLSAKGQEIVPYFTVQLPPLMGVMTALVLAFILGLRMAYGRREALHQVFNAFGEVVHTAIAKFIIPLLPIFVLGIALNMAFSGQVPAVLSPFIRIIGIIFLLHIVVLLFQYLVAAAVCRKNTLELLWCMLPAYITALGTQSGTATIPVTLRNTIDNGVSQDVAGFVVPLCATIHFSGSMLKIVACAIAIMMMEGTPVELWHMVGFIMMLGVVLLAAPGVPGGAIMGALGVLQCALGFGKQELELMIALYIAMDGFGTACNVAGDGALALIINRIYREKKLKKI